MRYLNKYIIENLYILCKLECGTLYYRYVFFDRVTACRWINFNRQNKIAELVA